MLQGPDERHDCDGHARTPTEKLEAATLAVRIARELAGGALGLGLAWLGVRVLVALAPAELPRSAEIGIDPFVLLFAAGVSIVAAVIFGLLHEVSAMDAATYTAVAALLAAAAIVASIVPAQQAASVDPVSAIREV